jgi:hypothetical protein
MTGKAAPMKTNFRRQPRRSNSDRWRELLLGSASVVGREGIRLRIAHILFNPSPRETYFGYLGLNLLARSLGFEFIVNESDARFDVDRPSNRAVHLHEYRDGIPEPGLVHVTNWRGLRSGGLHPQTKTGSFPAVRGEFAPSEINLPRRLRVLPCGRQGAPAR